MEDINLMDVGDMMKLLENDKKTIFSGEVVHGRKIGRTIGFPTANLHVGSLLEAFCHLKGVYGVRVHHGAMKYNGVMNIGRRPTFKGEEPKLSIEVHILHFDQDIYGEQLEIDVLFFIRDERAFDTIDHLVEQVRNDIKVANVKFLLTNV